MRRSSVRTPLVALGLLALLALLATPGPLRAEPGTPTPGGLAAVEAEFRDVIRGVTARGGRLRLRGRVAPRGRFLVRGDREPPTGLVLSDGDAGMVSRRCAGGAALDWRSDVEIRVAGMPGGRRTYRARVIHRDRSVDTAC